MQWTEITLENIEDLYYIPNDRLIIAHEVSGIILYKHCYRWYTALMIMAKHGGYYYIEIPALKLNEQNK